MNVASRPLLSGRLEGFQASEVLQWMAHRGGSAVVTFRPAGPRCHGPIVSLHVVDGIVRALALTSDGRVDAPPSPVAASGGPARGLGEPRPGPVPIEDCVPLAQALGGRLVGRGWLTPGQLRWGLALQRLERRKTTGRPLGRILTGLGLLTPDRLDPVLREQALHALAALLDCRRGRFCVANGDLRGPATPLEQRVEPLLLRAAHLLDQTGSPPAE